MKNLGFYNFKQNHWYAITIETCKNEDKVDFHLRSYALMRKLRKTAS